MRVGFVGLGAMGLPMARNLHQAGMLRAVWNRTATVARDLAGETGCLAARDLATLAEACDLIVLCLSADAAVLEVLENLAPRLGRGATVIDCSTVSVETARQGAALLTEYEASFLDCPVSGGTEGARDGTLAIMAGGDARAYATALPVLRILGRHVTHMGPAGSGQAAKAANQIMVAGINETVTEALAFASAQGLPLDRLIELLGTGAAGNWFLSHRGPTMIRGEFPLGFKVRLHQKDLEICRQMAESCGLALPVVEMTLAHYRELLRRGHGDEDISALFRLKTPSTKSQDAN